MLRVVSGTGHRQQLHHCLHSLRDTETTEELLRGRMVHHALWQWYPCRSLRCAEQSAAPMANLQFLERLLMQPSYTSSWPAMYDCSGR